MIKVMNYEGERGSVNGMVPWVHENQNPKAKSQKMYQYQAFHFHFSLGNNYELRLSMLGPGPPGGKTKTIVIACDEFDVWRLTHLCMRRY